MRFVDIHTQKQAQKTVKLHNWSMHWTDIRCNHTDLWPLKSTAVPGPSDPRNRISAVFMRRDLRISLVKAFTPRQTVTNYRSGQMCLHQAKAWKLPGMVTLQLLCSLIRATSLPREADLATVLSELPSYTLGPSLLVIPPATTGKSLAPSSVCHMMHGHLTWVCDHQQKPQNSTMPSCNTTHVATQCCAAHHEAHHALGDLHAPLLPSHF